MICILETLRMWNLPYNVLYPSFDSFLALKKYNSEDEKVLILISSLMVWNKTPAKLKEIGGSPAGEGGEGAGAEGE